MVRAVEIVLLLLCTIFSFAKCVSTVSNPAELVQVLNDCSSVSSPLSVFVSPSTYSFTQQVISSCAFPSININASDGAIFDFVGVQSSDCMLFNQSTTISINGVELKNCRGTTVSITAASVFLSELQLSSIDASLNIIAENITITNVTVQNMITPANLQALKIEGGNVSIDILSLLNNTASSTTSNEYVSISGSSSLFVSNLVASSNGYPVKLVGASPQITNVTFTSTAGLVVVPLSGAGEAYNLSFSSISTDALTVQTSSFAIFDVTNILVNAATGAGIVVNNVTTTLFNCELYGNPVALSFVGNTSAEIYCNVVNNSVGLQVYSGAHVSMKYPKAQVCSNTQDVLCSGGLLFASNRSSNPTSMCSGAPTLTLPCRSFPPALPPPRNTYYELHVAEVAGNPDGYPRPILGVFPTSNFSDGSKAFPGPLIRAQVGDSITVNVFSYLDDKKTSIHFHGLHMFANPWADGVDGITECGIAAGANYTYRFKLAQKGTHWYHSHSGTQYVDGLLGALIVDDPQEPISQARDYLLVLGDWFHETGTDLEIMYAGPIGVYTAPGVFRPQYPWTHDAILINGKGNYNCNYTVGNSSCITYAVPGETPQCIPERVPYIDKCTTDLNINNMERFFCPYGERVRLRFINTGNNLPLVVWIDEHPMTVVARDGIDTEPYLASQFTIPVAQRLDIEVECNADPTFDYKINVGIAKDYIPNGANLVPLLTYAILSYDETATQNLHTSSITYDMIQTPLKQLFEFQLRPLGRNLSLAADERIVLNYTEIYTDAAGWPLEEWIINNITFRPPKTPFLQNEYLGGDISDILVSEEAEIPSYGKYNETYGYKFQRATHVIQLELGKVYEILLYGITQPQQHPWHIHGYTVDFTDYYYNFTGTQKQLPAFNPDPVQIASTGDSFTVPTRGYTIFRFNASNPGPWFMHCHVDWHMKLGMSVLFNVGVNGTYKNLIEPAPPGFQVCGVPSTLDYLASLKSQIQPNSTPAPSGAPGAPTAAPSTPTTSSPTTATPSTAPTELPTCAPAAQPAERASADHVTARSALLLLVVIALLSMF